MAWSEKMMEGFLLANLIAKDASLQSPTLNAICPQTRVPLAEAQKKFDSLGSELKKQKVRAWIEAFALTVSSPTELKKRPLWATHLIARYRQRQNG